MVFVILNYGEIKFYLSDMKHTEKFFLLSLFCKSENMFFKGDKFALWNILQKLKNKKAKIIPFQ